MAMAIPTRFISRSRSAKMHLLLEVRVIYSRRVWEQCARTFSHFAMSAETIDVSVKQGKLRGVIEDNVDGGKLCAFRGIPYAKAPLAQLRFKDPEPAEPWVGVKDASKFGDKCAHYDVVTREMCGSDDCLYLNVYTNDVKPATKRPVMVYVHGGGFVVGSGNDDLYGPDYLVKKDVVVVTINYRLGVLGFLNLDHEVAPGNQGLKDQVMALRWVKDNISNFGGDPTNVTIFGESAGGAAVHYLSLSPLANGLFHKVIAQSGVAVNPWATVGNPKKFGYRLAESLGMKSDDPREVVEFLRTIEAHQLVETTRYVTTDEENMQFMMPFGPTVDDKSPNPFLPQPPQVAMLSGVKLPFLLGHNTEEGAFLTGGSVMGVPIKNRYEKINQNFEALIPPPISELLKRENVSVQDLRKFYFGDKTITKEDMESYAKLAGDMHFNRGIYDVVKVQCERVEKSPTYFYHFSYDSGMSFMKLAFAVVCSGATHGDELPFLFNIKITRAFNIDPFSPDSVQYKVLQRLTTMWTNFAKTGNPTPTTTELIPVKWKPVDNGPYYDILNIGEELKMETCRKGEQSFEWKNMKNKL